MAFDNIFLQLNDQFWVGVWRLLVIKESFIRLTPWLEGNPLDEMKGRVINVENLNVELKF